MAASDLASLLAAKKGALKQAETRDTGGPRIKKGFKDISEADVDAYYKSVQDANIETWEKHLGDLTFRTVYLPMSVEDATAFTEVTKDTDKHTAEERQQQEVSQASRELLASLEARLQGLIDSTEWGSRGVFVKTSSRSAKDAAVARARLIEVYKQKCRELGKGEDGSYTINSKIIALLHAGTQMLKCATAKDAMEMLTQSERIHQDMTLALTVYERRGFWEQHLAVREWVDIDVSQEWRCFIKARQVNAVSQYNYLPCFPELLHNREYLTTISFFNKGNILVLSWISSRMPSSLIPDLPKMWFHLIRLFGL
jgi:hypothetical protein